MEFNRRIALVFRFTAITLAIAGLYVLLEELEVNWITPSMMKTDWYVSSQERKWDKEAEQLPQPDATAKATWPRQSRLGVWDCGLLSGRAAQILGVYSGSQPERQEKMRALAADWMRKAADWLQREAGITPAPPLSFRTLADFTSLPERIDRDENGMAALISRRFSAQHGYLYKLGMLVGRDNITAHHGSEYFSPDYHLIGRNATLADLPRELWYPLTLKPAEMGIPPDQLAARHQELIKQIGTYLAAQE